KDADSFIDQVGPPNVLLINDGNGSWHDGTKAAGLDLLRNTLSPAFADFDGDGWPDLYLGNDFARANLYRNDHGKFRDISAESGAKKIIYGMGASWGDVNGDGKLDLYASAMQSSAGARIMSDDANFRMAMKDEEKEGRKLAARGNTLLSWDGTKWTDLTDTKEWGAARNGNWGYGGIFVDVDGDGWQDLLSMNGFFTAPGAPPDGLPRDL
ncbi:MAG TPA: VCBS repeat-containing protein, partial [bacterium]|nr:VCBS repeat-containing protein [bacterium]